MSTSSLNSQEEVSSNGPRIKGSLPTLQRVWALIFFCSVCLTANVVAQNVFSVKGNKTYVNDKEFQCIGLRCSNALLSDQSINDLISHLDEYKDYGVNTISAFFMGSRFSDIHGYNLDGTLKPEYGTRMAKLIDACNKRNM